MQRHMPFLLYFTAAAVTGLSVWQLCEDLIEKNPDSAVWASRYGHFVAARFLGHRQLNGQDPAVPVSRGPEWEYEHEQLIHVGAKRKPELVFLGDSITYNLWQANDVLNNYWAEYRPQQLGIAGDETQHLLWRILHGELDNIKPRVVVILIGTNNLSAGDGDDRAIAGGVTKVIESVHALVPEAKILLMGIFPRGSIADSHVRERIRDINLRLAKLDNGSTVKFIDISDLLTEKDGKIKFLLMPDYLHLSHEGCAVWLEAIRPAVDKMLGVSND